MSDITFEALKLVIMVAVLVITRYLIPYLRTSVSAEKLSQVQGWVEQAVLMVQQVYGSAPGEERKKMVVTILGTILQDNDINLSERQIDILIEAAVKQMKMAEGR